MAKLLIDNEWYEPLGTQSLYESEYERIVIQRTDVLFPGYSAVHFKTTVSSEEGSARADYALIETGYRSWWVVEVELGHHSLTGHVMPQVSILARARYGPDEATYIARQRADLDQAKLIDLMKGHLPEVLVVVNTFRPDWIRPLQAHRARLAVFEVFRSPTNRYVYRFNGFAPSELGEVLSICRPDPDLPWLLRVFSPAALGLLRNETAIINFEGQSILWERVDAQDRVWLSPRSRVRLIPGKDYELSRGLDGSFQLSEKRPTIPNYEV